MYSRIQIRKVLYLSNSRRLLWLSQEKLSKDPAISARPSGTIQLLGISKDGQDVLSSHCAKRGALYRCRMVEATPLGTAGLSRG
jgi:hypothetical protein